MNKQLNPKKYLNYFNRKLKFFSSTKIKRYRRINRIDLNTKLVFIVGAPRSGTTWLWGLLTSHPEIYPIVSEDIDPSKPSVVGNKRITSETGLFINYSNKTIQDCVYNKIRKFPGKVLVEKTPKHIFYIKKIWKLFPESKIIYVIRDPRAVVSSMLNSYFFKFADSIEDAINKYYEYNCAIFPFLNSSKVKMLKYEDLHCKTAKSIKEILEFIGTRELSEKEMQNIIKENHRKVKVDIDGVFRIGTIDSYKDFLTKDEIQQIEKKLGNIITFTSNTYKLNLKV